MTTPQRFERDLSVLLEDLYLTGTPDYRNDLVRQLAATRQRPAWTFPGRWLHMDLTTERVPVARMPWRAIGLVGLLAVLLAASLAVYIGSQPRLPDPFGLASNGLVAYSMDGDIHTADPVTGRTTNLVSGPERDLGPRFSRDGTAIAFERRLEDGTSQIWTVGADGGGLTLLTTEPVTLTPSLNGEPWEQYQFSPDGRTIAIASLDGVMPTISIAQADGTGLQALDVGMPAYEPSFRPTDATEVLFVGRGESGNGGIFAIDLASGSLRTIVEPVATYDLAGAEWSPDGSRIAYWKWGGPEDTGRINARTHVIAADGTGDRALPDPPGAVWNAGSAWSNDGTSLLIVRGYAPAYEDVRAVVIPADGRSTGMEVPYDGSINGECCAAFEWAPDDSKVLATPSDIDGAPLQQVILDPLPGVSQTAPWKTTSDPTWQRKAP
jgi:dipeptidyl aminopeptidase/acylaminoacyl peptidase